MEKLHIGRKIKNWWIKINNFITFVEDTKRKCQEHSSFGKF